MTVKWHSHNPPLLPPCHQGWRSSAGLLWWACHSSRPSTCSVGWGSMCGVRSSHSCRTTPWGGCWWTWSNRGLLCELVQLLQRIFCNAGNPRLHEPSWIPADWQPPTPRADPDCKRNSTILIMHRAATAVTSFQLLLHSIWRECVFSMTNKKWMFILKPFRQVNSSHYRNFEKSASAIQKWSAQHLHLRFVSKSILKLKR